MRISDVTDILSQLSRLRAPRPAGDLSQQRFYTKKKRNSAFVSKHDDVGFGEGLFQNDHTHRLCIEHKTIVGQMEAESPFRHS